MAWLHRTQNVRHSGVSVVPNERLKASNQTTEKLGTENTGSKGTRDEMRRMNWFDRTMRFESNLRYGSVDWIPCWFAFVLFNLFV